MDFRHFWNDGLDIATLVAVDQLDVLKHYRQPACSNGPLNKLLFENRVHFVSIFWGDVEPHRRDETPKTPKATDADAHYVKFPRLRVPGKRYDIFPKDQSPGKGEATLADFVEVDDKEENNQ